MVAVIAIAVGVALALAISLVNRSALDEFSDAIAHLEGRAQAQIRARGRSFDETLYARLARQAPGVDASPVIDASFALADRVGATLRVVGIDVFRAARVTPGLVPRVADGLGEGSESPLFADDTIFLSNAALASLSVAPGERIVLAAAGERVSLRVAGTVPGAAAGQSIGVMDVGTMQWRLGWLGQLTRIDLRFDSTADAATLRTRWNEPLAGENEPLATQTYWTTPEASDQRAAAFSHAYRVNLNVLALVALVTGAFIVHSTLALVVARQHRELALLAVLGARPRWLMRQVLTQGLALGALGSLIGVLLGIGGAAALLACFGGDLGGGYFTGARPSLVVDPLWSAGVALAGIATGVIGSLAPARALRRTPAARTLRAGGVEEILPSSANTPVAIACFVLGGVLLAVPPIGGIPWGAYAAIASWLVGAIAALPAIVGLVAALAGRYSPNGAIAWLAVQRLRGAPRSASAATAGVVAAFALACAMAIMVTSFRDSVSHWLTTMLPADAYVRVAGGGARGPIDAEHQHRIASVPGIARVEFLRVVEWNPDARRPPVAILVRPLDADDPSTRLAIVGELEPAPPGTTPVYVSEAMVDLYGYQRGTTIDVVLPVVGNQSASRLFVAAVWRDYARQHGSVVIDSSAWRALGGDASANDAAIWFDDATPRERAWQALRASLADLAGVELRKTGELRAASLRIFDRSFAVTYALEAVAIAVALFGVASAWAAEGLARRREFAILQHLGLARRQIARMFALEAALQIAIAIVWGTLLGVAIALVLIHRVNPQSFHWTIDFSWPGTLLAVSAGGLLVTGTLAAVLAAIDSVGNPVRALAEDA